MKKYMYFFIFLFSLFCSAIFKNVQNLFFFFKSVLQLILKCFLPEVDCFANFRPDLPMNACRNILVEIHWTPTLIFSPSAYRSVSIYMFYVQKYVQKFMFRNSLTCMNLQHPLWQSAVFLQILF